MADWKEKVSRFFKTQKFGKDSFLIMILGGLLLLVIAWPIGDGKETKEPQSRYDAMYGGGESSNLSVQPQSALERTDMAVYAKETEERLQELLQTIDGVGRVEVMITYASSYEIVPLTEVTQNTSSTLETDSGGARTVNERNTSESVVYTVDGAGNQVPCVITTKEPEVVGVAVSAEGGGSASIRQTVTQVIQSLFRIEANRIVVTRMKS